MIRFLFTLSCLINLNLTFAQCNNWLQIRNYSTDFVTIGDLDINGNTITVEASFYADTNYNPSPTTTVFYDLVSKYSNSEDCNYFLRPTGARISTTTGSAEIVVCDFTPKKINHVALVYNGTRLKFYRNGYLMSDIPHSGTLITNDLPAKIANHNFGPLTASPKGFINEVRIWNTARTQEEIKTHLNTPLLDAASTTGLVAYYQFDNLINKQGNAAWNGLLNGEASISNSLSNCSYYADSCGTSLKTTEIRAVINYYTPVISFAECQNQFVVGDGSGFKVGDTVLIIQMKGVVIDSTNSANFGTITDYRNTGNYEFNYVKRVNGNVIELSGLLQREYDFITGSVQMIRVPYYYNARVTDTLTCQPWNGSTGGVLVLNAFDTVTLNSNINVSGKGFRGANGINTNSSNTACGQTGFFYPSSSILAAAKGEGVAVIQTNKANGRGAASNGGGGGVEHNSGGGGGANGSTGGLGGYQWETCGSAPYDNRGAGGKPLTYSNVANKIFMGGGGGAGQANNPPFGGFSGAGANGGGILIVQSKHLVTNNNAIVSNGDNAIVCQGGGGYCHEAGGGGGSGGTILMGNLTATGSVDILLTGGKGADMTGSYENTRLGPGGGGSGGVLCIAASTLPTNFVVNRAGGANGVCTVVGNDPWGSTPGANGIELYGIKIITDSVPFRANIDSLSIIDSITSCKTFLFSGIAYTNKDTIQTWQWNFGDNNAASLKNVSHTYNDVGTYVVKLTVTDVNGCTDSITKTIIVSACDDTTINSYTSVFSLDICTNSITVADLSTFNPGDTVVIMQMKGAAIDSSNTINFGNITNLNNAGLYEFNYIKSKNGNTIELQNTMLHRYNAISGKVQLIRVPYFSSLTVNSTLSCPAWDGTKGGVLIINSANEVNLNAPIDVSSKGFYGGSVGGGFSCGNTDLWAVPSPAGGKKGEGIADYIPGFDAGGGRLATGGGGAYAANSGGGGGGNYGAGGLGGSHSNTCANTTQSMQGAAGNYSSGARVFAGGGGGGGQQDDGQAVAEGGRGGGIVIIKAITLNSNNQRIVANGESVTTLVRDEGGAGGGAGGSVVLFVNGYAGNLSLEAKGGDGSSNNNIIYPTRCHGPGGGGGGGFIGSSLTVLPPFVTTAFNGGEAGKILNPASACFNTTYNASDGENGGGLFNLSLPIANVPFVKNIDSVEINESLISCKSFNFNGNAYTNNHPIANWQWHFGDDGADTTQNTTHTYARFGPYNVKLIATDINGCKDSITKMIATNGINFDFVHLQDPCNPTSITFKAVGDTTPEIFWSLGDGAIISNIRNPVHIYADTGSYYIQYSTGNANSGCVDTISKRLSVRYQNTSIITTPDTTICFGDSKLLRSIIDSTLQFCWSPTLYLDNTGSANPVTFTPKSITYSLLAGSQEPNIVINGNFNLGNNNFTSDFAPGTFPLQPGDYFIGTSSINAGPDTDACVDNTDGTGSMLIARSNGTTNGSVWTQTVSVLANTTYRFSFSVQGLQLPNNTALQMDINDNSVLTASTATSTCIWNRHAVLWNSGNNTTVKIAIKAVSTAGSINDYFAIDDISFCPWSLKKDSVVITVDTATVNTIPDTAVCEAVPLILNTSGAATFSWTPGTGLSNPNAQNPVATPVTTTKYVVTSTTAFGCSATDSVTVVVKPSPVVTTTGDTAICFGASAMLFATGGSSYLWFPSPLLNDPNSANPVTNPSVINTQYTVTVTADNGCIKKDSFIVAVKPLPLFSVSPDTSVCLNTNTQLNAAGGNKYAWTPAFLVNDPNISNPNTLTTNTTLYTVQIEDTTCGYDTTLSTTVTILSLPVITATKENDISCVNGNTRLFATGAVQYNWSPASSLNNPAIASPVASPVSTTTYTVTGTGNNNCSSNATITVFADYNNKPSFFIPNAFSPNGDGINDCFRLKYFGTISNLQLTIFNRWGQMVFFSTNASDCWDGTFKNTTCDAGNFTYHLKAKTLCGDIEKKGNIVLLK